MGEDELLYLQLILVGKLEYPICEELGLYSKELDVLSKCFQNIPNNWFFFINYFLCRFYCFTIPRSIILRMIKACKAQQPYPLGSPHSCNFKLVQQQLQNVQNNQHVFPISFDGNDLVYLLMNQIMILKVC